MVLSRCTFTTICSGTFTASLIGAGLLAGSSIGSPAMHIERTTFSNRDFRSPHCPRFVHSATVHLNVNTRIHVRTY